jgi:hypothetical protein
MTSPDKDRDQLQRIARSVLNKEIGILDAASALLPLFRRLPETVPEEDFKFVVAIESETDDLPLGRVRELWHPDALAEKDREIRRCEELWGEQFRAVCERILLRSQRSQ